MVDFADYSCAFTEGISHSQILRMTGGKLHSSYILFPPPSDSSSFRISRSAIKNESVDSAP